jgi:flagellar P-ring protein FlgI
LHRHPTRHRNPTRATACCDVALWLAFALASAAVWWPAPAQAARIKEVAAVQGVRHNQLTGYGLVVGLDGTGDQTTQTPFTTQSLNAMLQQMGVTVPPGTSHAAEERGRGAGDGAAAALCPAGADHRHHVSSLGNAKSLRGGTLIATPLKGADGRIYAMAQGNLIVGGAGASAGGAKVQINHLSAGRMPDGATVERACRRRCCRATASSSTCTPRLRHRAARWPVPSTPPRARARRQRGRPRGAVRARPTRTPAWPSWPTSRTCRGAGPAGRAHRAQRAHRLGGAERRRHAGRLRGGARQPVGDHQLHAAGQPAQPAVRRQTVATEKTDIAITQQGGSLMQMPAGTKLADVVKALNALGATPQDLLAILQAMKSAGALRAEIEVI